MIDDVSYKKPSVFSVLIVLSTVAIGALCLYDLYLLYRPIRTVYQITLMQVIYSIFLVGLWIACWYSVFYGLVAMHIYIKSRRIIGPISSEIRRIMISLCTVSRMARVVTVSRHLCFYAGLMSVLASFVFANWRLLFVLQLVVVVQAWLWVRISTPPVIILLSSSHPKCIKRHWGYKRLASPLRVVSLLDFDQAHTRHETELHLDCLRATNDDDWWKDIAILLNLTPIIIIDTSIVTDGVLREAQYVLSSSLTYKNIFLTGLRGEHPILDRILIEQPIDIKTLFITDENRALGLVDRLMARSTFPTKENPLKRVSQD